MKRCLLVLGMHRSGTSSVAGYLYHCGIFGGKSYLPPLSENPKGFYEDAYIYEINEQLLIQLGISWSDNTPIKKGWQRQEIILPFKRSIKSYIQKEFEEHELFFLKEPRISILLPLYLDIFKELNIKVYPIIVRRDYYEIAQSLKKRNNYSLINGIALSYYYTSIIDKNIDKKSSVEISYDKMLKNPTILNKKFFEVNKFQLPYPESNSFIDVSLKHHKTGNCYPQVLIIKMFGWLKHIYFIFIKVK